MARPTSRRHRGGIILSAIAATLFLGYRGDASGGNTSVAKLANAPLATSLGTLAAPPARYESRRVREAVCASGRDEDWQYLCSGGFVEAAVDLLLNGDDVHVVQIGAHVGFERNDPISRGLAALLDRAANVADDVGLRRRFHWTFVEPSPPNFKRLEDNLSKHADVCDMNGINAAVVPDGNFSMTHGEISFYSIRDTVDPETGQDSLSGQKLPYFITQISSLNKISIQREGRQFKALGLDVDDYIVQTNVTAYSYSDLMQRVLANEAGRRVDGPLLVLVDTEGYDCTIVEGISTKSPYLPRFLVFEHRWCLRHNPGIPSHLNGMGYSTNSSAENIVAVRQA